MPLWPERSAAPVRWWAQTLAVVIALVWVGLLLLTAAFVHARGPVGVAFDVAIGAKDPFSADGADPEAVALAAVSWLMVPAVVGTVAALVAQALIQRSRPFTRDDWGEQIEDLRSEFEAYKRAQTSASRPAGAGPGGPV